MSVVHAGAVSSLRSAVSGDNHTRADGSACALRVGRSDPRTRLIQSLNRPPIQVKLRRFDQIGQLLKVRGAGDGGGYAGASDEPSESDAGRGRTLVPGDLIQGREDAEAALVQVRLDPLATHAFRKICLRAILARQEPLGQREIGNDADAVRDANRFQLRLIVGSFAKIVVRLQALVAAASPAVG